MKYMSLCIGFIGLYSMSAFAMEPNSSVSPYGLLTVCNLTRKEVRVSYPSHLTNQTIQSNLPAQLADRFGVDMSRSEKVVVVFPKNQHIAFPMIDAWQAVGISEAVDQKGLHAQIHMLDELGQRERFLGSVLLIANAKTTKRAVPIKRAYSELSIIDEDREATWVNCDNPREINPNPFKTTPHRPRVRTKSVSLT